MMNRNIQEARKTYGIDGWGNHFYGISSRGTVEVYPFGHDKVSVCLSKLAHMAQEKKIATPVIFRFPQILESQLGRLHQAFTVAMEEAHYKGSMQAVFPFKVNQRKEFIDELVMAGKKHRYGLEAGSKPELIAALSYDMHPDALMVCNGFKDSQFIELAFDAKKMGKNIVLVIEGTDELEYISQYAKSVGFCVDIGLRAKLYAKGSGLWEKSSGAESKFGLSTVEMAEALSMLKESGLEKHLVMLHYHIGSQITEIKRVKNAMKEAARVYSKICNQGFQLRYLNIGGGIGVDYDGSKTSFYASANYTLQEFANDVVYIIRDVCDEENCTPPIIVSESGRAVAAYHAVLVTDVREVEKMGGDVESIQMGMEDHRVLNDLFNALKQLNAKNFVEIYHDAVEDREELFTLFNLGYLELDERAKAEILYNEICTKCLSYYMQSGLQLEEFDELSKSMISKYLANFSIFQSIPDSWSIEQLFPVMPIQRLDEKCNRTGVIMDITCDSDGCLDHFVDQRDVKHALELHIPHSEEPYYIGFFLVGAYQEALGNNHNLFGAVNEMVVRLNENTGAIESLDVVKGEDIGELLRIMNFQDEQILKGYELQLQRQVSTRGLAPREADRIVKKVKDLFNAYPYLLAKSRLEIVG